MKTKIRNSTNTWGLYFQTRDLNIVTKNSYKNRELNFVSWSGFSSNIVELPKDLRIGASKSDSNQNERISYWQKDMFFIFGISWNDILTKFKDLKIISNAYRKTISLKRLQKGQDQMMAVFWISEAQKIATKERREQPAQNMNKIDVGHLVANGENAVWNFWQIEAFILIELLFSDNIQILDKMFLVFEIEKWWLTFDEFLFLLRSPSALFLVVFGLILCSFQVITRGVFALVAQGGSSRQPTCGTYSRSSAWSQILPYTSSRIWLLPRRFLGSCASLFSVVSQSRLWLHVSYWLCFLI